MSEWKKIKLKEILKEVSERNKGEKVKRVLSVTNSQGFVDQEEYFEGTVHSTNISNYKIIRKNQFAYNPSRVNVGSIDILKKYDEGAISPMYVIFEVDESKILPEFFMYYFQTHRFFENVKNNTQGSVRNSLNFKALADFDYLLPSLEEQRKIVKVLNNVDSIIEKYESLLKNKEQFIKSQFVRIFNNCSKIKLKNVVDIYLGLTHTPKYVEKGIPFLSSKNISAQKVDFEDIKYISKEEFNQITENAKPIKGDILFSRVGSNLGNPTILEDNREFAIFVSLGFLRIKDKRRYNSIFIKKWMESDFFWHQVFNKVSGGAKQNLNTGWLKEFEIFNPTIDKQNDFANIANQIDKQKFELEKMIRNYQDLKKGLMQQLLTGKIKVKI